jgi:hypothetical protein
LWPGNNILPFCIPQELWDAQGDEDWWIIYGDGKLEDADGAEVPGNWGTVDIGGSDNSTDDLVDQINNGLRQEDLDDLKAEGRIDSSDYLDCSEPADLDGEPGMSIGIKSAVRDAKGKKRIIPIYESLDTSSGLEFHVRRWGIVTVGESQWQGEKNTYVYVQKDSFFSGKLRPQADLSNTGNVIEGAYTSPVLVQ